MQLLNDSGSRTKIKSLMGFLLVVKGEAEKVDSELAELVEDHDETWIEAERESCDTTQADVDEYLAAREHDPPSTASLTDSWVKQHAPGIYDSSSIEEDDVSKPSGEVSDVNDHLSQMSFQQTNTDQQIHLEPSYFPRYPLRPPVQHFSPRGTVCYLLLLRTFRHGCILLHCILHRMPISQPPNQESPLHRLWSRTR